MTAIAVTTAALAAAPRDVAAQTLATFDEHARANTRLAPNALAISARVTFERQNVEGVSRVVLVVRVQTENSAATDTGVGCVRVGLLRGGAPASSFITCTPQNPPQGLIPFARPTVRRITETFVLPEGLHADSIGFRIFNREHEGESLDWLRVAMLAARFL